MRRARIVGRCAVCNMPVMAHMARRVLDLHVLTGDGRPVRRLAHAGECEKDLRARIARG